MNSAEMIELIRQADKLSAIETAKHGLPTAVEYDYINNVGLELANRLKADKNVVQLGTRLMDLKIGQALKEKKTNEHIELSLEETKRFLKNFNLKDDFVNKVLNCIEAHHATKPFICIEAEICANADCYRFLAINSCLRKFYDFCKIMSYTDALNFIKAKIEEKHKVLSLEICRKELEPQYQILKTLFEKAKEQNQIN